MLPTTFKWAPTIYDQDKIIYSIIPVPVHASDAALYSIVEGEESARHRFSGRSEPARISKNILPSFLLKIADFPA